MNKDLDDRLMPEGEYRDALNVSINKSQGDGSSEGNVGTLQTVLGNQLLQNISNLPLGTFDDFQADTEFIGILPSDAKNSIYGFLTNNTLTQDQAYYVPKGAVGITSTYPLSQDSGIDGIALQNGGFGFTAGSTYNVGGGSGTGMTIRVDTITSATDTSIATFTIINSGSGYVENDSIELVNPSASGVNALFMITSTAGPISLTTQGSGYTDPVDGTTTTAGNGTGLIVSCTVAAGAITFVSVVSFGAGYSIGDVVTIDGGNNDATFTIQNLMNSFSAIVSYNLADQANFKVIVEGAWLNFSTQNQLYGINLIEDLLFFTDNRNQPRKVNINRPTGYYTTEEQISVAKYYPCDAINLYQPSEAEITSTLGPISTGTSIASTSTTLTFSGVTGSAPSTLGVFGSIATLITGGSAYPNTNVPSPCTGGTGRGVTVTYSQTGGVIQAGTVVIVNPGSGYTNGDILTISSSTDNNATFVFNFISPDTFVVDSSNWPTSVVVNNPQVIPTGMTVNFVTPETTMQNASDLYLPADAEASDYISISGTPIELKINPTDYSGFYSATNTNTGVASNMNGYHLYFEYNPVTQPGVFTDSGSKVTGVSQDGTPGFELIFILNQLPSPTPAANLRLRLALPNPYYDSTFAETANIEYLNDKFVRFSYRFKYDDGEYSLMAPFTQPCFIPEQDGYFMDKEGLSSISSFDDGGSNISDEENAYRSTEVSFMENKVNKITLNVPLPCPANDLVNRFKVQELDILYKESDQTAIKVVDSIPVEGSIAGNGNIYQYEYGSKPPFKTLPQAETVRVYDKVPVKALSQEVASNRIIYGNFQNKHTPPAFLDYTLGSLPKQAFNISENIVNSDTSSIEYPNATLKQNRTYEVGIVLSDKFGRQSTVLFSKQSEYAALGEFLASSIYSPYRGEELKDEVTAFDGNALNIQFNSTINSLRDIRTGSPGIYNGDINSQNYNPLGWYSFKVVVKQTEQDYYNVYIPTAMAAYPLDRTKELTSTSHIVLYNDNINKIPRDLTEVGPTQKDFPSSVRLFGRVSPYQTEIIGGGTSTRNAQFYPSKIADITTNVATIKDLFDYEQFPRIQNVANSVKYVFYNFDYLESAGESTFSDSSSLVARINTQKKFGVQIPRGVKTVQAFSNVTGVFPDFPGTQSIPLSSVTPANSTITRGMRLTSFGGNVRVLSYNPTSSTAGDVILDKPVMALAGTPMNFSGDAEPFSGNPALNVYEVTPNISLIDIYYETTTSGLIENLNKAIDTGPPPNVFSQLQDFIATPAFNEAAVVNDSSSAGDYEQVITLPFQPVTQTGTTFPTPVLNNVLIDPNFGITDLDGNTSFNGIPYFDTNGGTEPNGSSNGIFGIRESNPSAFDGKYVIILKKKSSPGCFAEIGAGGASGTTFLIKKLATAKSWPTGNRIDPNNNELARYGGTSGVSFIGSTAIVGASVTSTSGVSFPDGTIVVSWTPSGVEGEGTLVTSNAPNGTMFEGFRIIIGKESPGLVFSEPAGNTFRFNFLCSNTGEDSSGIPFNEVPAEISDTLTLKPVNPKRPKVQILKKGPVIPGTIENQIDLVGGVYNQFSSQLGGTITQYPQPIEIDPDVVLSNPLLGFDNTILAYINCINGSSTIDLQKIDLELDIIKMYVATDYITNPNWKWLEIGVNPWNNFAPDPFNTNPQAAGQNAGFPRDLINDPQLANVDSAYNDPNNHWTLQLNNSNPITDPNFGLEDSFYYLQAEMFGINPTYNENVAYCLEIAARDADNNAVGIPSTFVGFVLRRGVTGGFNEIDVPINKCTTDLFGSQYIFTSQDSFPSSGSIVGNGGQGGNDPGFGGPDGGVGQSISGSWSGTPSFTASFTATGPVQMRAYIQLKSIGGTSFNPPSDFPFTLSTNLTITQPGQVAQDLFALQGETIFPDEVIPAPLDLANVVTLTSPSSPCQIGGSFSLEYNPQFGGGVIPQPLPVGTEVELVVVIQYCALA